jgi:hypothetical protein
LSDSFLNKPPVTFVPKAEPQLQPLEDNSMNPKLTALTLATATAFAFTAKPAVAGDKELAVVGGVIGGLIIASAINDHHDNHSTVVVSSGYRPHRDDGYWRTVEVRVWVPGGWIYEHGHHGRSYRRYVEGHYECRTDRVWVAYDRHHRHDHRDIGRGYGRDHDGHPDHHDRDHRR